jgi:hypothetical protein
VTRLLERYAEAVGLPQATALVQASGDGGSRQGLGFWLPLAWEVHVVPARDFVFLARARLARIPLGRTGDELRDGHGRFRVGRRVVDGDVVDRSQHAALWAWTLVLAPASALRRTDVFVESAGDDRARVAFPFRSETWECSLAFDRETGLLRRLDTHREEIATGRSLRFAIEVEQWRARDGRPTPARLLTRWDDVPAFRLDVGELRTEL